MICDIDMDDSFTLKITKINILDHVHMAYTGAEISLLVTFGATRTIMRMDLGFGDYVEPIDYSMNLTTTSKGPLFESKIFLRCYPREFIFAEKLETLVFRGASNTRMKDFHDLYSLVELGNLDISLAEKAIQLVFHHRKTSLEKLPIVFDQDAFERLEKNWNLYLRKLKKTRSSLVLPESIEDVVLVLNEWLNETALVYF